ncbi:MAG: hypothetical protein HFG80_04550 [Eubacterium sp.]|nr:hypothetical protein [Eubacterium sp.]
MQNITIVLAEENPFDEAGNCYILYGPDSIPMKSGFLMLPTSDNIFYTAGYFYSKEIHE